VYNREQELARREREQKESAWEQELLQAMGASDPTGSHLTSIEDHKVSTSVSSTNKTVDTLRTDSLLTDTSERRKRLESKSMNCTGTVPQIDHSVRTRVINNAMKRDETGRRHSDQSNKGAFTNVLPLLKNKSEVASCEDHMPKKTLNQRKHDVRGKELCKDSEHGLGRRQEHCRSCPKLFLHEQSSPSSHLSSKPLCFGQDAQKENITAKSQQKDYNMPKSTANNCKCQITEKCFDIPCQKLDIAQQNQSLNCNIQTQLSETKESVEEYTTENNILVHGTGVGHSSSQCQGSSRVLHCSKHGSLKSHLDST
jgi:hypothetical protein